MDILGFIRQALVRPSFPEVEFAMENIEFFLALLRACPQGSRLTFDQRESAAFVIAFREWSHRSDVNSFEADYYTIDPGLISLMEQLASKSQLELYCHFAIGSPRGGLLCSSWDDFTAVKLDEQIEQKIREEAALGPADYRYAI
jgi:hypothetical protein